jgi:hypothetical protein
MSSRFGSRVPNGPNWQKLALDLRVLHAGYDFGLPICHINEEIAVIEAGLGRLPKLTRMGERTRAPDHSRVRAFPAGRSPITDRSRQLGQSNKLSPRACPKWSAGTCLRWLAKRSDSFRKSAGTCEPAAETCVAGLRSTRQRDPDFQKAYALQVLRQARFSRNETAARMVRHLAYVTTNTGSWSPEIEKTQQAA